LSIGPKENHTGPAVNRLFRSAALNYGAAVIILSGTLDNGTAGLLAIENCCGIAIVQQPTEAEGPSMPLNALRHVSADYRRDINEIGPLITSLPAQDAGDLEPPADPPSPYRDWIAVENEFADAATVTAENGIHELGTASSISCPECRSVLFEVRDQRALPYRCRVGHAFSAKTLLRDLGPPEKIVVICLARDSRRGGSCPPIG
jgi:two-component system, chemotaxis family, protein-glutamate methylesterase/glutaminase